MKRFLPLSLAVLPLLSILAMSPSQVESKFIKRGIASVEDTLIESSVSSELLVDVSEVVVEQQTAEPVQIAEVLVSEKKVEPVEVAEVVVEEQTAKPVQIAEVLVSEKKVEPVQAIIKVEEKEKNPKLKEITSTTNRDNLFIDPNLDSEKLKAKRDDLKIKLLQAKEDFKKGLKDEKLVEQQRREIEELVINLLLVEGGLKELLRDKKIHNEDSESTNLIIAEAEDLLEGLLTELQTNEKLVASSKNQDEVVIASAPKKVKKSKTDENEADEEDEAIEDEEENVAECEHDKNKVLTEQVDSLVAQQNKILEQMLNMSQMFSMQSMMMQQQMMMMQMNRFSSLGTQTPYQYASETAAGNWVYYPSGRQPSQPNIFASNQAPSGYFPEQAHESNWNLKPQMSFENMPGYMPAPQNGTFGMNSFNFENAGQLPPRISLS